MTWRKVRPKKKTPPTQVVTEHPPRMSLTPEESIRRTEAFITDGREDFINAIRNGRKAGG
jgi:hypothetical protein